jgi:hypothetical protein
MKQQSLLVATLFLFLDASFLHFVAKKHQLAIVESSSSGAPTELQARLFAAGIALSFVHPWGNRAPGQRRMHHLLDGSAVPDEVRHVLEKKCADCHSTNTEWPLCSRLAYPTHL